MQDKRVLKKSLCPKNRVNEVQCEVEFIDLMSENQHSDDWVVPIKKIEEIYSI